MKYGEQAPRHRYVVKARRMVRSPKFGPEAYHWSYREVSFAFGKGQPHATGAAARQAADEHAKTLFPLANEVAVWAYNGYGGTQVWIKQVSEQLFDADWEAQPAISGAATEELAA